MIKVTKRNNGIITLLQNECYEWEISNAEALSLYYDLFAALAKEVVPMETISNPTDDPALLLGYRVENLRARLCIPQEEALILIMNVEKVNNG
jgi:hypothetical protein